MATWAEFVSENTELAARVRDLFDARKHKTMATLRRDGSPRISGTETRFEDGELLLGMMPGSMKELDLRRDARVALHGPTVDAPEDDPGRWVGDAKIAGVAVPFPTEDVGAHFRIDIAEVVLTTVNSAEEVLVIESWHEGRGRSIQHRA